MTIKMEPSPTSTRQAMWLLRAGIALFLAAALLGLAISHFTVPRLALSGHLIALLQGIFLVVLGLLWPRLSLTPIQASLAFWLLIYQAVAAPVANLLAAAWLRAILLFQWRRVQLMAAPRRKRSLILGFVQRVRRLSWVCFSFSGVCVVRPRLNNAPQSDASVAAKNSSSFGAPERGR